MSYLPCKDEKIITRSWFALTWFQCGAVRLVGTAQRVQPQDLGCSNGSRRSILDLLGLELNPFEVIAQSPLHLRATPMLIRHQLCGCTGLT
jgi:hypothetical protein